MAPARPVPRFELNLDDAPELRWRSVIDHFRKDLQHATTMLEDNLLPEYWIVRAFYKIVIQYCNFLLQPFPVVILVTSISFLANLSYWWIVAVGIIAAGALGIPHRREIIGIGRSANISPGKILIVQYVYELVSACTSVIVRDATMGVPIHLRVMDWEMPGMDLQSLVCEVTFKKNDRCVLFFVKFSMDAPCSLAH